jgi:hypothetical protein
MLDWDKVLAQLGAVSSAPIPFFVALLIVAGFIWWAINWRYSSVLGHRDAEISRLKAEKDDHKKSDLTKTTSQAAPSEHLIKDAIIEWDGNGSIFLTGRYTKSGGELVS